MNLIVLFVSVSVLLRIRTKAQPVRPVVSHSTPYAMELVTLNTRTQNSKYYSPSKNPLHTQEDTNKSVADFVRYPAVMQEPSRSLNAPPCGSNWECAAIKGLWLSRVMNYVLYLFYNESCDKFKAIAYLE